jgi:UV DNA damage endonuclease
MRIRFGYVAIALGLPQGSPNKRITLVNLNKIEDNVDRLSKLSRLARENLATQLRVLRYNVAHNIKVFRITSHLIPLATHPITCGWDYCGEFRRELSDLGEIINKAGLRISAHPDHFTVLNSPIDGVVKAAFADLHYHDSLFNSMGLDNNTKLVLHVGGLYKDKPQSLGRFRIAYYQLTERLRERVIIENDDKSYTAKDVLNLCQEIKTPMVLDVHHHNCCNGGTSLSTILPDIFETWGTAVPKIHFSSPKGGAHIRAHADYINIDEFVDFLSVAKECNRDFDVMIEAKQKDLALFALMEELKKVPKIKVINEAEIEC